MKTVFIKRKELGFTLIELLVVIAIIGILAGVVIASLNSARNKSRIASIKSNLKNLQTQAQIYFNDNGTYVDLCTYNATGVTAHASIQPMIDALTSIAGAANVRCVVRTADVPSQGHYISADALENKGFGVAVYFDETHYGVDASSVITLDKADTGAAASWADAAARCAVDGKRLPAVEVLKAVNDYGAQGGNLSFPVASYWSSTAAATGNFAYVANLDLGLIVRFSTATLRNVRCAS